MSITRADVKMLQGKTVYDTDNETYVLDQLYEKNIIDPQYKILGFQNNYMYVKTSEYLMRCSLYGVMICQMRLNVEYGAFYEGLNFMYFYLNKTVYKVNENFNIEWEKTFDDIIQSITLDMYGSLYIIFKNSRTIRKLINTGKEVLYLSESDDVTKKCKLYTLFITSGGSFLFVIGSEFGNDHVESFIDKYNTRTGKRIERQILLSEDNVSEYDDYYSYNKIAVEGDYIYIFSNQYIQKVNIKMRPIWKYSLGYNPITGSFNTLRRLEYDDTIHDEYILFSEDLYETNGNTIGKLSIKGDMLWKIYFPEYSANPLFQLCIYKDHLYTVQKKDISLIREKILSLNNNKLLFLTRDNRLVKIIEDNSNVIYGSEFYSGVHLLASRRKEGVRDIVQYFLGGDNGSLIETEDSRYILVDIENDTAFSPDNYEYGRLTSSWITDKSVSRSYIGSNNKLKIATKYGSSITTKNIYQKAMTIDFLTTTKEDNKIRTMDNRDIILKLSRYDYMRHIIADRHMFNDPIVTKRKGDVIITKKNGYAILRKKRTVYSFVLQKFKDIDLIVEYLKENGILDTDLPKYVEKLRKHTASLLEDIQESMIPSYFNIKGERKFSYWYNAEEFFITEPNVHCYICNNIPYIDKRRTKSICIDSMANMVLNREVKPFIVFINGKAIKWSNMVIIRDWFYSYIMINNLENSVEDQLIDGIVFPTHVRYGEDNDIDDNSTNGLYFDTNGVICFDKVEIAIRIEQIDDDMIGEDHHMNQQKKYIAMESPYNIVSTQKNVLMWEDGLFKSDSKYYLKEQGGNIFTYEKDTIGDVYCKTFYYTKAWDSKDIITKIYNQDTMKKDIIDNVIPGNTDYSYNFLPKFDFKMTTLKPYDVNVAEAVKFINSYDVSLFAEYYKKKGNIESYIFKGDKLLQKVSPVNTDLKLHRIGQNLSDSFIIVFKNNTLYDGMEFVQYAYNIVNIPIYGYIEEDDILEVVFFKNVNNDIYHFINGNGIDYLSNSIRYNNFDIYGNGPSAVDIPAGTLIPDYPEYDEASTNYYQLDFTYKNNHDDNGKYTGTLINIPDKTYNGRMLNIVSKKQFHSLYVNMGSDKSIKLTQQFKFATNKMQYIIFVNGKKINSDKWELVYAEDSNNVRSLTIRFTNEVPILNSSVSVFYIPDPYEEIIMENYISNYGVITVEENQFLYPFHKELFMVFVNGDKIKIDDIDNISKNEIRIKTDYTTSNITICKFLQPDDLLKEIYSYADTWSKSISSLTEEEFRKLMIKIQ